MYTIYNWLYFGGPDEVVASNLTKEEAIKKLKELDDSNGDDIYSGYYTIPAIDDMIKEGIHINGLYQHWKGGYYKVEGIAYYHELIEVGEKHIIVIYSKCDKNGVYISIRDEKNSELVKQPQPFYRHLNEFTESVFTEIPAIPRFKFIKDL